MTEIVQKPTTLSEACRQVLQQRSPADRRGRNYAQTIAAVMVGKALEGKCKAIKVVGDAARKLSFASAIGANQSQHLPLSAACGELLAKRVPGDRRGRTFSDRLAIVVVSLALRGNRTAIRELNEASKWHETLELAGKRSNCLIDAYVKQLAQPCPGDKRGRTLGERIEAITKSERPLRSGAAT